jgi:N-glycosylase/DNA lyase
LPRNTLLVIKDIGSILTPVLQSHGWINLAPAQRIADGFRYSLLIDRSCPVSIEVISHSGDIRCYADRALDPHQAYKLRKMLSRMLSLDFPIGEFCDACKIKKKGDYLDLAMAGWGRMLRSPSGWEDAVKTLCTTNASWPYTQSMCRSLCSEFGETTPSGDKTFPHPNKISRKTYGLLFNKAKMGYRTASLIKLSRNALLTSSWLLNGNYPCESALYEEIRSWAGFGKYATDHLMVLLGFYGYLPIDREVALYLGVRNFSDRLYSKISRFNEWGKFRFVAYKLERIRKRKNWTGEKNSR